MTGSRRRARARGTGLLGRFLMVGLPMVGLTMAGAPAPARAQATPSAPPRAAIQIILPGSSWILAPRAGAPAPANTAPAASSAPPPSQASPSPPAYDPRGPSYPPSGSYPPAPAPPLDSSAPAPAAPYPYPYLPYQPPPGYPPYPPYEGYPPYGTYPPYPPYPPSASALPPGATYPQKRPRPAPGAPRRRIFQLAPYLGVHSYWGQETGRVTPGIRAGGMLGLRLSEVVSINGELTLDDVALSDLPAGDSFNELDLGATISPLFSVVDGRLELAFGPKLGFWLGSYNQSSFLRGNGGGTFGGLDLGANVAGLAQVGRHLWLGALASFDVRTFRSNCFTPSGGTEGCTKSDLPPADRIFALSLLLLFSI